MQFVQNSICHFLSSLLQAPIGFSFGPARHASYALHRPQALPRGMNGKLSSDISHATRSSRSRESTPATDASSPRTPDLRFIETPEIIARREQNDSASAEMGRRLLQGWAMLADECPNPCVPFLYVPCSMC